MKRIRSVFLAATTPTMKNLVAVAAIEGEELLHADVHATEPDVKLELNVELNVEPSKRKLRKVVLLGDKVTLSLLDPQAIRATLVLTSRRQATAKIFPVSVFDSLGL